MPVQRDYTFANGKHLTEVEPEFERRFREMCLNASVQRDWRNDPTYNLNRRRK